MLSERSEALRLDRPAEDAIFYNVESELEGTSEMPKRRPAEETARIGDEIYEREIRPQVEVSHHGEVVSIDVDSGNWAVDESVLGAAELLRAQCPGAINVWSVRVGHRAVYSFGGSSVRRAD